MFGWLKGVLSFLGGIGKGWGTILGLATTVVGALFGGGKGLNACFSYLQGQPANGAVLIGVLLTAFGIGRKAGWLNGAAIKAVEDAAKNIK